jgi:hypothetical protein
VTGNAHAARHGDNAVVREHVPVEGIELRAVSRRTPVAASIRRSDQPSRPSARTRCRLSSLKMLLMAGRGPLSSIRRQHPGVHSTGRIWVSPEACRRLQRLVGLRQPEDVEIVDYR